MSLSDHRTLKGRQFDPEIVIAAYRSGFFPMADSRTGPISWFSPNPRAVIPLFTFHVPRSVRREMKKARCGIAIDRAFDRVIRECAERGDSNETWISDEIIAVYSELHRRGYAHSVETWQGEKLAGGLYGVTIGGAFFGESMFSRETGMSKFALVYLVEHLRTRGFTLLDTQIINDHIRQFGAIEIPRDEYLHQLEKSIALSVRFTDQS